METWYNPSITLQQQSSAWSTNQREFFCHRQTRVNGPPWLIAHRCICIIKAVWKCCVHSTVHLSKLSNSSKSGHGASLFHTGAGSLPQRSRYHATEALLIIKFSQTLSKHCPKMWHDGPSLEPLCNNIRMGEMFSSLSQSVNKHLPQKIYSLSNKLKRGCQLRHLQMEKSHVRSKCSDWMCRFISFIFIFILLCRGQVVLFSELPTSSLLHLFSCITNYSSL